MFQVTGILPDMLISFYGLQQGGLEVGGRVGEGSSKPRGVQGGGAWLWAQLP